MHDALKSNEIFVVRHGAPRHRPLQTTTRHMTIVSRYPENMEKLDLENIWFMTIFDAIPIWTFISLSMICNVYMNMTTTVFVLRPVNLRWLQCQQSPQTNSSQPLRQEQRRNLSFATGHGHKGKEALHKHLVEKGGRGVAKDQPVQFHSEGA